VFEREICIEKQEALAGERKRQLHPRKDHDSSGLWERLAMLAELTCGRLANIRKHRQVVVVGDGDGVQPQFPRSCDQSVRPRVSLRFIRWERTLPVRIPWRMDLEVASMKSCSSIHDMLGQHLLGT